MSAPLSFTDFISALYDYETAAHECARALAAYSAAFGTADEAKKNAEYERLRNDCTARRQALINDRAAIAFSGK